MKPPLALARLLAAAAGLRFCCVTPAALPPAPPAGLRACKRAGKGGYVMLLTCLPARCSSAAAHVNIS